MRRVLVLVALASCATACVPAATGDALRDRATATCHARTGQTPPTPFTTDACTLSLDGTWAACCVEHDVDYWCGGSADDRRRADTTFRQCVVGKADSPLIGAIYYYGVRAAGVPWLPVPWRWGYGWPWPHGYSDR